MCRLLLLPILLLSATLSVSQKTYDYPIVPKDSIYDKYHGITIYDPYQWMENPEDPRLEEWIKTQKKINAKQQRKQGRQQTLLAQTASMYNDKQTTDIKENIVKEKRKLSKYEFNYYWSSYNRAQDLRYRKRGDVIYKSLVKIKHFQEDRHDLAIITDYDVNEKTDVAFMAISHKGSDWRELHFYDLKTGEKLPDTLLYVRNGFDFIWHDDGLYYTRFEAPKKGRELLDVPVGQSMYFHKMGTKQHKDKLLYENKDTTGATFFGFTEIDSLLFLDHYYYHGEKTYKALSYEHIGVLDSFKLSTFLIYPNKKDIVLSPHYSYGDSILIVTNWNAPNWKVLVANTKEKNKLSEFIPEYDIPLSEVNPFGKDKLACIYKNDGKYTALIHDMQGELIKMQGFPAGKKLNYFYENSKNVHYTSFCLSSFYHPDLWYQISLDDYTVKPIQELSLPYNPFEIETKYVTYKSKDGTEIPMYITHLKDIKMNGKNPTLLYGYGGYGITVEPNYDPSKTLFILHGGILAVPHVRGGGAKGNNWSLEGRGLKKRNTVDDFIAAAEYLIDEKYTKSKKLAIMGASHGAMLVGAAITQRPELFKAAIAEAGPFDLLRKDKFTTGATVLNTNEYGDVSQKEGFDSLLSYSPLHNIKKGVKYPNILLITGDNDDRVPPLHSYKFLATLQEKGDPTSLYQIYIVEGSGHGGALTSNTFVDYLMFKYYYLYKELDLKFW